MGIERRNFLMGATAAVAIPLSGCGGGGDGGTQLPTVNRLSTPASHTSGGTQFQTLPEQHALVITDAQGNRRRVGGVGRARGKLNYPVDVVAAGSLGYVVEVGNHRVQVFDSTGASLGTFGDNELFYPGGITANLSEIFVADSRNKRVAVFSLTGQLLRSIGANVLSAPRGVALYGTTLLVADPGLRKVLKFDIDGKLLGEVGTGWVLPWDVATDGNLIYVADTGEHEVSVLDMSGKEIAHIDHPRAVRYMVIENGMLHIA